MPLIGGAFGAAAPVVGMGVSAGLDKVAGRSLNPKQLVAETMAATDNRENLSLNTRILANTRRRGL